MSSNATTYNNILAFGATAVDNDSGGGFENNFRGTHAITIRGRIYHKLHDQSSSDPSSGMGFYLFDYPEAMRRRGEEQQEKRGNDDARLIVDSNILDSIYQDLQKYNAIAQEAHCLGKQLRDQIDQNELIGEWEFEDGEFELLLKDSTRYLDVGILHGDSSNGNRIVRFTSKSGEGGKIELNDPHMEPFSYPLLFNRGELGWGDKCANEVGIIDCAAARVLQTEPAMLAPALLDPEFGLKTNRFQILARLGQVWIVDMISRMIDRTLRWVTGNQTVITGKSRRSWGVRNPAVDGEDSDDGDADRNPGVPEAAPDEGNVNKSGRRVRK
jgi:hypothetical protein